MKIHDSYGRSFAAGLIGEVPTGRLLWVDQINGNDDLAVRGRLSIPFATLNAAKNQALSGDTIIVLPGTYGENSLAKDGVNWHFLNGAVVQYSLGGNPIFRVNSAMTFRVTGEGRFIGGGLCPYILQVADAASNVVFRCRSMESTTVGGGINITACTSVIVDADTISAVNNIGIWITSSPSSIAIRARLIYSQSSSAVEISGGSVEVDAYTIKSNAGKAIRFGGGSAIIRAAEIISENDRAVEYSAYPSTPPLTIRGARIISKLNTANGNPVYLGIYGNNLKLGHCVLLPWATAPSIACFSGQTVNLYGECAAKTAVGAGVTIGGGSPLNINASLSI